MLRGAVENAVELDRTTTSDEQKVIAAVDALAPRYLTSMPFDEFPAFPSTTLIAPSLTPATNPNPLAIYLKQIQEAERLVPLPRPVPIPERSPPPPRPVLSPEQIPECVRSPDNIRPALPAPKFFRMDKEFYSNYRRISRQLHRLFEGHAALPPIPRDCLQWLDKNNLNMRFLFSSFLPAIQILNAAKRIADSIEDPTDPVHASCAPLLNILRKVVSDFAMATQAPVPDNWMYRTMDFADVSAARFYYAPPQSPIEEDLPPESPQGSMNDLAINYFGQTQPDNDIIVSMIKPNGKVVDFRILSMDTKDKSFNYPDLMGILHELQKHWYAEDLRAQALRSDLPIREAFKRIAQRHSPFESPMSSKMERFAIDLAKESTYSVQMGQTYGFESSGTSAAVTRVDWTSPDSKGDIVYVTPIEFDGDSSTIGTEPCSTTNAGVIAVLILLNIEAGIQDNATIQAAGERMARFYSTRYSHAPPSSQSDQAPSQSSSDSFDPSGALQDISSTNGQPPSGASTDEQTTADHLENLEDHNDNPLEHLLDAELPENYIYILPCDTRRTILRSAIALHREDREGHYDDLIEEALELLQGYHAVAAPFLPVCPGSMHADTPDY